jgi:DNA polymerase I-like protein with 3'-5' exonuclease and polymerase domains
VGHDGESGEVTRRVPHVLTTAEAIERAVLSYRDRPNFVIDVETDSKYHATNNVRWVGIGAEGVVHLIPCQHPKGAVAVREHVEKVAACLLYPEDDPRHWTPTKRQPSWRMVDRKVETTYSDVPEQLYPHEVMDLLRPLMFSDKGKVGHNVKFDLQSIAKYYGGKIPPGPYHDTLVATHILDEERRSYDLKTLTADWFKVPLEKRKEWYPSIGKQGVDNFGLDVVARYLAKDLRYCWMRFQDLIPRLESKGLRLVYDFEMQFYASIMEMESAGFPVDLSKMKDVRSALEEQIAGIENSAWDLAGDQFPLSNLDAKRWVLFGEGIPVHGHHKRRLKSQDLRVRSRTVKQDVPQVTSQVLEYYADRGNRMAELLKTWAELEKLRGTFIEGIHGFLNHHDDGLPTVHSSFKLHGTVTGRLSASEPNIHQLPREQQGRTSIRELFVAGPGKRLVVADYDQIELRCAGFLSGDPEMVRVFKRGEDIHRSAAAAMFRLDPADVSADLRQVGKAQPLLAKVLTPQGFIRMGEIVVGTEVVDPVSGEGTKVVGVYPQGERPVYRLTFNDGTQVRCDAEHLWQTDRYGVKTTQQMLDAGLYRGREFKFAVPKTAPVEMSRHDLPIPPYVVGVLIGDGNITGPSVLFANHLSDRAVADRVALELPNYQVKHHGGVAWSITQGSHQGVRGSHSTTMQTRLRSVALFGHGSLTKRIPFTYRHTCIQDRVALLQGLIDTDGSVSNGGWEYSTGSPLLASDVEWVVRSLGGWAKRLTVTSASGKPHHRVRIVMPSWFQPHLARKWVTRKRDVTRKAIVLIQPDGVEECQCIAVDTDEHLYLTDHFTVTHNTQNFAVLYGAGEQKIALVARCSLERAQELIRSYFTTFSELEKWKYRELQQARKRGDRGNPWTDPPRVVIPPFGRLRRLPMLFELDQDYVRFRAERQAINALCQGFAAYVTKLAMVGLHETLPAGATMIAQVHDEIIVLADEDIADEVEIVTKKVMEGVVNPIDGKPILGTVPLVVSAASGDSWATAKG